MKPTFKWSLVTPADFARSIRWAKTQPNLGVEIRRKCLEARKNL